MIIDVRKPDEFQKGHVEGSCNIPLQEMEQHLDEIKKMPKPVIVVCGGGTRSVKAFELLQAKGIVCEHGGSWKSVGNKK